MKFSGRVGNGPMNERLNFGGDKNHGPDPDPYRDTGKTCLGGGMHCPSASSYYYYASDDICCPVTLNELISYRIIHIFTMLEPVCIILV